MADIVLINPRFEVSFWGMEHALPLIGRKANLPVACLPLLAALTPEGHQARIDLSITDALPWADPVVRDGRPAGLGRPASVLEIRDWAGLPLPGLLCRQQPVSVSSFGRLAGMIRNLTDRVTTESLSLRSLRIMSYS